MVLGTALDTDLGMALGTALHTALDMSLSNALDTALDTALGTLVARNFYCSKPRHAEIGEINQIGKVGLLHQLG